MAFFYKSVKTFALIFLAGLSTGLFAQTMLSKQVIIANGGKYEASNPTDWVSVQSFSPVLGTNSVFDTIFTQSVQDVVVHGKMAWVAAQDSIVAYNLDTYTRIAAVADSGLSRLCYAEGQLIVTKQYPLMHDFVQVRNANDLSLLYSVPEVSGEAAKTVVANGIAYVAVNSGWMGVDGKIAVINLENQQFVEEIALGSNAIGIADLYLHDSKVISVNRTPYGSDQGSISVLDTESRLATTTLIDGVVSKGFSVSPSQNLLYFVLNNGVASFDLTAQELVQESIIEDQGSASWISISSGAYDESLDQFYVNITDYASFGQGKVFNSLGDSLSSFILDIAPESCDIQYVQDFQFDDLTYIVGEGEHKAIFLIDFRDGSETHTYAWGYRFDGEKTAEDMLNDIVASDENLNAVVSGGFLNDIVYKTQSGIAGEPDWWSTWSGNNIVGLSMNMGLSEVLTDGAWFGCSYGFMPIPVMPSDPTPAQNTTTIADKASLSVQVFPNPATDYIRISGLNQTCEAATLTDISGQEIIVLSDVHNNTDIQLQGLSSGIYLLQLNVHGQILRKKIIKN